LRRGALEFFVAESVNAKTRQGSAAAPSAVGR
jgi:hypothetical protein